MAPAAVRGPVARPRTTMPGPVRIWEVGPRDGLQNEAAIVPADVKAAMVDRLAAAGLPVVEVTSFVHPSRVPQLADAEEVMARVRRRPGVRYPVLVPNRAGLERALASGATDVCVFASATETFARRNLNRSRDEALAAFEPVVAGAKAAGAGVRAYVSMCFGDPWEGDVAPGDVLSVAERLLAMGCDELSLGDTIGVATTGQVVGLLDDLERAGVGLERVGVHFHDTYGQALANSLAAVERGVTTVDASAGGIGGCPFAESATGNLATEDLCWALAGLGIETGVDLVELVATSVWMASVLGRPSPSKVVQAMARGLQSGGAGQGEAR